MLLHAVIILSYILSAFLLSTVSIRRRADLNSESPSIREYSFFRTNSVEESVRDSSHRLLPTSSAFDKRGIHENSRSVMDGITESLQSQRTNPDCRVTDNSFSEGLPGRAYDPTGEYIYLTPSVALIVRVS